MKNNEQDERLMVCFKEDTSRLIQSPLVGEHVQVILKELDELDRLGLVVYSSEQAENSLKNHDELRKDYDQRLDSLYQELEIEKMNSRFYKKTVEILTVIIIVFSAISILIMK